jgi:hypothetical protein
MFVLPPKPTDNSSVELIQELKCVLVEYLPRLIIFLDKGDIKLLCYALFESF